MDLKREHSAGREAISREELKNADVLRDMSERMDVLLMLRMLLGDPIPPGIDVAQLLARVDEYERKYRLDQHICWYYLRGLFGRVRKAAGRRMDAAASLGKWNTVLRIAAMEAACHGCLAWVTVRLFTFPSFCPSLEHLGRVFAFISVVG